MTIRRNKNLNFLSEKFPLFLATLIITFFTYLFSTPSLAIPNHSVITLTDNDPSISISFLEYLPLDHSASIEELISDYDDDQWITLKSNQRPRPKSNDRTSWFRFDVSTGELSQTYNWDLVIGWTIISSLQVHFVDQVTKEIISSEPVGLRYPFSYQHARAQNLVFPLSITNKNPVTVYFEMSFTRTLMPPLKIMQHDVFLIDDRRDHIIIGVVMGSLLVMLLYNLSLSLLLLNKTYFYYSCYTATVIMYLLPSKGLAFYSLWDDMLYLKSNGYAVSSCISFIAAALFFNQFLQLKERGGWVFWLNKSLLIGWCILLVPTLFLDSEVMVTVLSLFGILTCIAATVIAIRLAVEKNIMAFIFLIAWSFVLIGTITVILTSFGFAPVNNFTSNVQMVGVLLEMILLSFALAVRINQDKVIRLNAQREALELAQRVSDERRNRLLAQKKSLQLQQELNSNLETQVNVRTEQLEETMQKLEAANTELLMLSVTDALTGIHNRRYFDEEISKEWKRAYRENLSLAVVIADIDHFKPINDTFGHTTGDKCIRLIADSLKQCLRRPSDLVARYGGEEFIFVLPGCNLNEAMKVAENCRQAIEKIHFEHDVEHDRTPVPLSISAGVAACIPSLDDNFKALINAADSALYNAKSAGRNCVKTADLSTSSI